jgi:iron(III) transport system substrate-binding protein
MSDFMATFFRRRPLLVALAALAFSTGCGGPRVVLYCAQDPGFAEGLLQDFQRDSGLTVATKFDSEKDKSVSLYRELVQEKGRPRCDVFWNNEILSTLRLQKQGLLEPYDSPARGPFPGWAKATDHTWTAFAQRARVLIVNTKEVNNEDAPQSLFDLTDPRWRGRVVMAKPLHGTSITQAVALFEVLGPEQAKKYYRDLNYHDDSVKGLQIAPGNKQVAEWVAAGRTPRGDGVAVGITDTDDAIDEVQHGSPVRIIFPDAKRKVGEKMGTLFIPNALAILKGCPNPEGARRLVDFLLRPEVEKKLAEGDSHQIPVSPAVSAKLPEQILTPKTAHSMQVDWPKAADLWEEAFDFLRQEFAGD